MRILFLLEYVPGPSECARTGLDSESIVALATRHEIIVAVDENTAGASRLRDAGITVHVSDKRHVHLPDAEQVDADTALAEWIRSRHCDEPFQIVITAPERAPFGTVRRALPDVPWGVLASAGPTAHTRRLSLDADWIARHGHDLWRAASHVTAADVVISPVAPSALALDTRSVDVRSLEPPPTLKRVDRVAGELIVVALIGTSHVDATSSMAAALDVITLHDETTLVVLHSGRQHGNTDVTRAIAAAIPDDIATQTLLVPTGRHERAGDWLIEADGLVLGDAGELVVPALARAAERLPTVLLGERPQERAVEELTSVPDIDHSQDIVLLPWTNPTDVASMLRVMQRAPEPTSVVLHEDPSAEEAARWRHLPGITRFDVVVGALPRAPWSAPRTDMLAVDILCLHRSTWTAVADELDSVPGLRSLVNRVADLSGMRSHTMGAITVEHPTPTSLRPRNQHGPLALAGSPLRDVRPPPPDTEPKPATPKPAQGTSPAPAPPPAPDPAPREEHDSRSFEDWVRATRWPVRARLALPWRLGLGAALQDDGVPDGVTSWVKEHTIRDRARLLLPWRWGLLPRAMKERW